MPRRGRGWNVEDIMGTPWREDGTSGRKSRGRHGSGDGTPCEDSPVTDCWDLFPFVHLFLGNSIVDKGCPLDDRESAISISLEVRASIFRQ